MDEKRNRSRLKAVLPVRLSASDNSYSELVHTLDITECGARLGAVHHLFKVGSVITLQYKQHRGLFRVIWTRRLSGQTEHQVGLEAMTQRDFLALGLELRSQVNLQSSQAAAAHLGA